MIDRLAARREEILRIAHSHGAQRVRVFGSVARGEAGPNSDVDLLVDLQPGRSFLDLIAIEQDVEDLLGQEVDVVTEAGASPYVRERVVRSGRCLVKSDAVYLRHIIDAAERIARYVEVGRDRFWRKPTGRTRSSDSSRSWVKQKNGCQRISAGNTRTWSGAASRDRATN